MFTRWLFAAVFVVTLAYFLPSFEEIHDSVLDTLDAIKKRYLPVIVHHDKSKVEVSPDMKLFTAAELQKYTGESNGKLYLSIMGKVFDVTKGRKHYAKGESYHGFVGKDASKAFITGDFTASGLTDDLSDVSPSDLADLHDWQQMYEKDYEFKGKLIGRFYNKKGEPTDFLKGLEEKLQKFHLEKQEESNYKVRYPPCNVEWTPEKGSRIWCSNQSGGIKRDWVGVPRKFFEPGSSKFRCACVNTVQENTEGKFLLYDGCQPGASSCFIKPDS